MRFALISSTSLILALASCGGVPSGNELRLDDDENGFFSGTAGRDWTPAEIIAQACGANQAGAEFRVITSDTSSGAFAFGGRCMSGVTSSPAGAQNVVSVRPTAQTRPAEPQAVSPTSGSTYVSPYSTGYTPPSGFYTN